MSAASDGFFEDLPDPEGAAPSRKEPNETELAIRQRSQAIQAEKRKEHELVVADRLREAEDAIQTKATEQVSAALEWASVVSLASPPEEWIQEYGLKEAERRFIVAKAASLKKSEAPVGLELAHKTMLGIIKARASEKNNERPLGVQILEIRSGGAPKFPEVVLTEGEEFPEVATAEGKEE